MFQTRTPSRHHVYGDHLTPAINLLNDKTLIQVHPICFVESILIIVLQAALPIFDSSGYLLFYFIGVRILQYGGGKQQTITTIMEGGA